MPKPNYKNYTITKPQPFIPNWKRMGLASQSEAWSHTIKELIKNKDKITSRGLTNEATFQLGQQTFLIKGKKKKT